MDQFTVYIHRAGKKTPVSFQQVHDAKREDNPLFRRMLRASGNFGTVSCDECRTSLGIFRIIRLQLNAEVILSFACETGSLSFNFCLQGLFQYTSQGRKALLLPNSMGKLHYTAATQAYTCVTGPNAKQGCILLHIYAPFKRWPGDGFTGRMRSHFENLYKHQGAADLSGPVFPSNLDLHKWVVAAQGELVKGNPQHRQLDHLLLMNLFAAADLANAQSQKLNKKSWNTEEYKASRLAENMILGMDESWNNQKLAAARSGQAKLKFMFNKYIGMPAAVFKNSVRLEKAKQLLLHTPLMIREIAVQVGYINPSHFSRLFKSKMGYSPKTLRKKMASQRNTGTLL